MYNLGVAVVTSGRGVRGWTYDSNEKVVVDSVASRLKCWSGWGWGLGSATIPAPFRGKDSGVVGV